MYLGVRDLEKGKQALKDILEPGRVELLELDVGSMESVRAAAKTFLSKSTQLNVLVNNAGIMACPEAKTADGFESQLAINYLGHFLLIGYSSRRSCLAPRPSSNPVLLTSLPLVII